MKKRKLVIGFLTGMLVFLCGCGQNNENGKVLGIVPKNNSEYSQKIIDGIKEEAEKLGYKTEVAVPEDITVDSQKEAIQTLVDKKVDCIAISANAESGFSTELETCADQGIEVVSYESHIFSENVWLEVLPYQTEQEGKAFAEAAKDLREENGQFAIISTTNQDYSREAEIKGIRRLLESGEYPELHLTEIAYAGNNLERSVKKTEHLLETYPDLEYIFTMDPDITRKVTACIKEKGADIKVIGEAIPEEIRETDPEGEICPRVFSYDYGEFGKLIAAAAVKADDGTAKPQYGEKITFLDREFTVARRLNVEDEKEDYLNLFSISAQKDPEIISIQK